MRIVHVIRVIVIDTPLLFLCMIAGFLALRGVPGATEVNARLERRLAKIRGEMGYGW